MWSLYILIISILGVSVLFAVKIREIKSKQPTFLGRFLSKGDPFISVLKIRAKSFLSHHGERTFWLFLVHIPSRIEAFFKLLRARAHNYYHSANSKMRDRRNFSDNSVSPYMRSMSFRREGDNPRI